MSKVLELHHFFIKIGLVMASKLYPDLLVIDRTLLESFKLLLFVFWGLRIELWLS